MSLFNEAQASAPELCLCGQIGATLHAAWNSINHLNQQIEIQIGTAPTKSEQAMRIGYLLSDRNLMYA